MKKNNKKDYNKPTIKIIEVGFETLTANSPNAGLSPSIEKPKKDDDEEIFG